MRLLKPDCARCLKRAPSQSGGCLDHTRGLGGTSAPHNVFAHAGALRLAPFKRCQQQAAMVRPESGYLPGHRFAAARRHLSPGSIRLSPGSGEQLTAAEMVGLDVLGFAFILMQPSCYQILVSAGWCGTCCTGSVPGDLGSPRLRSADGISDRCGTYPASAYNPV